MPKYHVTARSTETVEFEVDADDLTDALGKIAAQAPEGFQVQRYMTVR